MQNSLLLKWSVVVFHLLDDKTVEKKSHTWLDWRRDQNKSSLEVGLLIWSRMKPPSNRISISSTNNLATNQQRSVNHNNISSEICMGDFSKYEVKNQYKLW